MEFTGEYNNARFLYVVEFVTESSQQRFGITEKIVPYDDSFVVAVCASSV